MRTIKVHIPIEYRRHYSNPIDRATMLGYQGYYGPSGYNVGEVTFTLPDDDCLRIISRIYNWVRLNQESGFSILSDEEAPDPINQLREKLNLNLPRQATNYIVEW